MKNTVVFLNSSTKQDTRQKTVDAITEVDEFGNPFAVEVLWFKRSIGVEDTERVLTGLDVRHIKHSYSENIDALTFSFGDGERSVGQKPVTLVLDFDVHALVGLTLLE